jgi:CRP-like cAMP-binding protein
VSQRSGENNTPVVKLELKRADLGELLSADPVLAVAPLVKLLTPAILAKATMRRFPDKGLIVQQGQPGESLFFVMKGDVRLFARRDSDSAELGIAHRGEFFGEGELLDGKNARHCSATAQGQVDVLEFSRDVLQTERAFSAPMLGLLNEAYSRRTKALDEMSDFLNRW